MFYKTHIITAQHSAAVWRLTYSRSSNIIKSQQIDGPRPKIVSVFQHPDERGKEMRLLSSQCIVIKIGSSLLLNEAGEHIDTPWLDSLIEDIAELGKQNIKIVLVSSGAIAYGKLLLNITAKQSSLESREAIASLGQIQLMHSYQALLNKHNMKGGQVLLSLDDMNNAERCIHLKKTLKKLMEMNIIPIINENDSVATEAMRYGDNDQLAAKVAALLGADTLVLLSDIDGLYTNDPRTDPHAKLIPYIEELTPAIRSMAKKSSTHYGSGGMVTKLNAAHIAMNSGCDMLITAGQSIRPISHFIATNKGTWFKSDRGKNNTHRDDVVHQGGQ